MCFFEMLDAKALIFKQPKNERLLRTTALDAPIAAQLEGVEPEIFLEAALKLVELVDIAFLDINSACPARKVVKKGAGAALLQDPARLGKIIKLLTSKLSIPITVKLRTGFHPRDNRECVRAAMTAQDNGASTVFIHGRTVSQGYAGDIDYEAIRTVKEAIDIPVFGSGNIFNPMMAKKMLDETQCDGILVARGARGNPWIFKDIENYLKSGETRTGPTLAERIDILKQHLEYIDRYKGISLRNKAGFMSKVAIWYLKGMRNATVIRSRVSTVKSYEALIEVINSIPVSP
jgi:tRNA-dihydrouridine synthase B